MQKRKEYKLKYFVIFFSLVISIVLSLIVGELYVRLFSPYGYTTPGILREESLEYEVTLFASYAFPKMEQTFTSDREGAARINKRGYRGPDFAVPKPEATIRIVFLGGSAVFDQYAPVGRDWPHLVEKELHIAGYERVEVINAGTPGHRLWDSLGRLYTEIWMFEPDYVVIYHAWNDIKDFGQLSPEQSLLRLHRPPRIYQDAGRKLVWNPHIYYHGFLDRLLSYSQLYVRLRSRYWSWQIGQTGLEGLIRGGDETSHSNSYASSYSAWGPRQYALNLRLIAHAARDIGAIPVFLTQARLPVADNSFEEKKKINYDYVKLSHNAIVQAFSDCDKAIFDISHAEKIEMLDLSQRFSGKSDLFADHIHTTPTGSEAIAKTVSEFLAGLLDKRP